VAILALASVVHAAPTPFAACSATEYCCPDAKHCLTPVPKKTCGTSQCAADETCCPLTKICVKVGAVCTSTCKDQKSYCCPDAKHCLTPTNPGTLCDPDKKDACSGTDVCCPLVKECVSVGAACSPDGPIKPKETNCTEALEAECEGGKSAPWNKNLTCAECVKVVVEKLEKSGRAKAKACDIAAKEFEEKDCKANARSKRCKEVFEKECQSADRPAWTKNLTCTECVKKVDFELLKKKGFDCKEEEEVFVKKECGAKNSCKDIGSHSWEMCIKDEKGREPCEWCPTSPSAPRKGGVCAKKGTPCPKVPMH
jgi:hypothetical protein